MTDYAVKWEGDKFNKAVMKALENQIRREAENVLQWTNMDIPFRDGDLQASGGYDVQKVGQKVIGSVFYDTPYAVRLHEHPEYEFGNGRKGLYLKDVLDLLEISIMGRIQNRIFMALRGTF